MHLEIHQMTLTIVHLYKIKEEKEGKGSGEDRQCDIFHV